MALEHIFKNLCPWLAQPSELQYREMESTDRDGHATSHDADIFCYLNESSQGQCQSVKSKGLRVVVATPALPAAPPLPLPVSSHFSPYDKTRKGPQKYFLAEAYSGENKDTREQKLVQLETLIAFTKLRWEDRTGTTIGDITSIIGVAGLVFAAGKESRSTTLVKAVSLVQNHAGPLIKRLMQAGRFFVLVLEESQMPNTSFQREIGAAVAATANTVAATANTIAALHAKVDQLIAGGGPVTAAVAAAAAPAAGVGGAGDVETLSANLDRMLTVGGALATAAASAAAPTAGVGGAGGGGNKRRNGGGRGGGRGRRRGRRKGSVTRDVV